jgi:hypothetical protein
MPSKKTWHGCWDPFGRRLAIYGQAKGTPAISPKSPGERTRLPVSSCPRGHYSTRLRSQYETSREVFYFAEIGKSCYTEFLMHAQKRAIPEGVRVGRSSSGLGLFAMRSYKKGERIIEYFGRTLNRGDEYTSRSKYLFEVSTRRTIDGATRANFARYMNHSCCPNCATEIERGRIYVDAVKKIKKGEELTYDYGEEYFNEHIRPYGCRCPKRH